MAPMMTSSSPRDRSRPAFTLLELLVVIGMIAALATILLPAVNRAYVVAQRTRMAADLQVVSQALENYHHDFGAYPRIDYTASPPLSGAVILCWGLVAPGPAIAAGGSGSTFTGDGADGPGFRVRGTTGQVFGPYLPASSFPIGTIRNDSSGLIQTLAATDTFDDSQDLLGDRNFAPILYFAANPGANMTQPQGFIAPSEPSSSSPPATFVFGDNAEFLSSGSKTTNAANMMTNWKVMSYRLGVTTGSGGSGAPDGSTGGQTPIATGPFLLWGAGPDGIFGTDDDVVDNGSQLQVVTGPLPSSVYP